MNRSSSTLRGHAADEDGSESSSTLPNPRATWSGSQSMIVQRPPLPQTRPPVSRPLPNPHSSQSTSMTMRPNHVSTTDRPPYNAPPASLTLRPRVGTSYSLTNIHQPQSEIKSMRTSSSLNAPPSLPPRSSHLTLRNPPTQTLPSPPPRATLNPQQLSQMTGSITNPNPNQPVRNVANVPPQLPNRPPPPSRPSPAHREATSGPQLQIRSQSVMDMRNMRTGGLPPNHAVAPKTDQDSIKKAHDIAIRNKVVDELIDTERIYVNDLTYLLDNFFTPLEQKQIIGKSEIAKLMGNLPTITEINKSMSIKLDQTRTEDRKTQLNSIAEIFKSKCSSFRLYGAYIKEHKGAILELYRMRVNLKEFSNFCKEFENKPESRGLTLSDYLIKPVQRLVKYPLLFKEILKTLDVTQDAALHQCISQASTNVTHVAEFVNSCTPEGDDMQRLLDIEMRLVNCKKRIEIVSPGRRCVMEGVFTVTRKKKKVTEKVFLFSDSVLFTLNLVNNQYTYKGFILLNSDVYIQDCQKEKKPCFAIVSNDKKGEEIMLEARTEEQKIQWFDAISKIIENMNLEQRQKEETLLDDSRRSHSWTGTMRISILPTANNNGDLSYHKRNTVTPPIPTGQLTEPFTPPQTKIMNRTMSRAKMSPSASQENTQTPPTGSPTRRLGNSPSGGGSPVTSPANAFQAELNGAVFRRTAV